MPIEPDIPRKILHSIDDTLIEAFKKIAMLVNEHAGEGACPGEALALVRVINNLDAKQWEDFARQHRISNWLYFPLQKDSAESVRKLAAIQNRLLHESDHDPLTGIRNRRYLNRSLIIEVERSARSQTELSLLYIDIDNFKSVNDIYGHDCGDMVLTRFAELLQSSVRHYDLAVRLGGDEFVVLLPTSSCWTGVMLGNRLLEAFSNMVFECRGKSFSLSFSAGISSLALCDEDEPESLLKSADAAMYEAKRKGKNSVVLAHRQKKAKDHASLVQAQEKLLLFSGSDPE